MLSKLSKYLLQWIKTLGEIGKVTTVYSDNDIKVEVCGKIWTFNPLAVIKISQPKILFNVE